jgi:REP element-mobilizing transposase RayT
MIISLETCVCATTDFYTIGIAEENEQIIWKNPFEDVNEEDWYYNAVKYVNENNLFKGITETKFGPRSPMTRGMMVTVLWRMEKEPVVNYLMMYKDVKQEEYYTEAIRWATSEKIIQGYSTTEFKPDEMLTRQEMVTMLYRYAMYKNMDISVGKEIDLTKFVDSNAIADYAIDALTWGIGNNVIKGMSEISLAPVTLTARCEVAVVIMRFLQ